MRRQDRCVRCCSCSRSCGRLGILGLAFQAVGFSLDCLRKIIRVVHAVLNISSTATHIIWYSTLESLSFQGRGILQIRSCRGSLIHERQTYDHVAFTTGREDMITIDQGGRAIQVQSAVDDPLRHLALRWELHASLGQLQASLSLLNAHNTTLYDSIGGAMLLPNLTKAILVNCDHPMNTPVGKQNLSGWLLISPCLTSLQGISLGGCYIFPTGGVESLQLYCLAWICSYMNLTFDDVLTVLRQRACFDCCLQACKELGSSYLVL